MMFSKKLSLSIKTHLKLQHINPSPMIFNGECHSNLVTFLIVKILLDLGTMELSLRSSIIPIVLSLFVLLLKFMIKMETNQIKMENSMDSKINNKLLM